MMTPDDERRLHAHALHDAVPLESATSIQVDELGYQTDVITDRYRLVISNAGYLYLTDRNSLGGCTCHGKGVESIRELIALLQRAEQIMTGGA